jgi:hypothetical protein
MHRTNTFVRVLVVSLLILQTLVFAPNAYADNQGIELSPGIFEDKVDPGKTYTFSLRVRNVSETPKTYYLSTKDIKSVDGGGRPEFAMEGEPTPYNLSTWITLGEASVDLNPGQSKTVSFSVAVPEEATPGSHFGGIFLEAEPPKLRNTGAGVGVTVGSLINLQISGEVVEDARLRSFSTSQLVYNTLPVTFETNIENLGNTLLRPTGIVEVVNMFGKKVASLRVNESSAGLFPAAQRAFTVEWSSEDFAFGRYQAVLSLVYGDDVRKTVSATMSFWVLPIKPISIALGSLLALMLVLYVGIRMYIASTLRAMGVGTSEARYARKYQKSMSKTMFTLVILFVFCVVFLGGIFLLFA